MPANTTNAENYEAIVNNSINCYKIIPLQNESICHNLQSSVQKCSQPLVNFFVDCLPEKSKDIPPAVLKSVGALVKNFCSSTAEVLLEDLNPCIIQSFENNTSSKEQCNVKTLETMFKKFKEEYPSKTELCQVVREGLDCWQDSVNHGCQNEIAKEFFSKVNNAIFSGCK